MKQASSRKTLKGMRSPNEAGDLGKPRQSNSPPLVGDSGVGALALAAWGLRPCCPRFSQGGGCSGAARLWTYTWEETSPRLWREWTPRAPR